MQDYPKALDIYGEWSEEMTNICSVYPGDCVLRMVSTIDYLKIWIC